MTATARLTPRRRALLRDLEQLAAQLTDDELEVLLLIGTRAWVGQSRYGCLRLATDRRDFAHEALEEVADATFYVAVDLLQRQRRPRRRGRRA